MEPHNNFIVNRHYSIGDSDLPLSGHVIQNMSRELTI